MRKGITPIISIIILLLITISMAGLAYTFLLGEMTPRMAKSFSINAGAAFCTSSGITIAVSNTGTSYLNVTDFIIAQIDDLDVTSDLSSSFLVAPSKAGILLSAYDCGGNCVTGPHTIDLGTSSRTIHPVVYCP